MNANLFDESFTNGSVLNGTIIRLPLRQDASSSKLSSKTLTPEEVRQVTDEESVLRMLYKTLELLE